MDVHDDGSLLEDQTIPKLTNTTLPKPYAKFFF